MSTFGWRLKSSQEINSKESHLERRGDELYSVTTKENYVKLLFERDTGMKNYARLVQLEKQYNALLATSPKIDKKQILITILLICVVFPIGIVYGIINFFKFSKERAVNIKIKGDPILAEARRLL